MSYAARNTLDIHTFTSNNKAEPLPIVIIGTGPVGIRALQLINKQAPDAHIVIYGNEPWEPYNRVKLSTFLAGDLDWPSLVKDQKFPVHPNIVTRFNCAITKINCNDKTIVDETGYIQAYAKLIIATGSHPHVPHIRGIETPGIFNFRDLNDVQQLMARRVRSRRTVILGGGVLGLEAAKAMSRNNTEVYIIDHGNHLMSSQLDDTAGKLVNEHILSLGIKVYLHTSVKEIQGENSVSSVLLSNGMQLKCDTIVLATGIRPNIELARSAGIVVARGIRVNDNMQTSEKDVFAIGECAEHRKIVYGLVAPGYEQAKVAAYALQGKQANYHGSITATKLKVAGIDVFSMGQTHEPSSKGVISHQIYEDTSKGIYRKLIIKQRRLVGAICVGPCEQIGRIQESIIKKRHVWPLQLRKFTQQGFLWEEKASQHIAQWPAHTQVCHCTGVTRGELSLAVAQGHKTVDALVNCTGASTVCGSCRPKLAEIAGTTPEVKPDKRQKSLLTFSVVALLLSLAIWFLGNIIYSPSVDVAWQWDKLWRENLLKQISGYTAIGTMLIAALISLRKRWPVLNFFEYANWRMVHTLLGVVAITALIAHTGLRMGDNFNFYLMGGITLLLITGVIGGIVISQQHRWDYVFAQYLREKFIWAHILLFWPIPVLVGFHIAKTYYY